MKLWVCCTQIRKVEIMCTKLRTADSGILYPHHSLLKRSEAKQNEFNIKDKSSGTINEDNTCGAYAYTHGLLHWQCFQVSELGILDRVGSEIQSLKWENQRKLGKMKRKKNRVSSIENRRTLLYNGCGVCWCNAQNCVFCRIWSDNPIKSKLIACLNTCDVLNVNNNQCIQAMWVKYDTEQCRQFAAT